MLTNKEIKTEEDLSSQNNTNSNDAEYFSESTHCKEKLLENWKASIWKCSYCNHIDSSYEILQIHLKAMHQISDIEGAHYQCNDCEESKLNYTSFLNHVRCTHYETLKLCCDICNEPFSNYGELALHREAHIEISKENIYPIVYHCSLCEKVHSTKKELKMHTQLSHSFVCLEEKEHIKASATSSNSTEDGNVNAALIQDKDEYNETEQIFQCGVCVNSFLNKSDLLRHLKIHAEDLPFICEVCGERFKAELDRKFHMRVHNNKLGVECEICSKCFSHKSVLKRHLSTHTEDRPFECELCKKCFKSHLERKRHMRIHTDERPYKCEICEKCFKTKAENQIHKRIHSDDRPFKCETCFKTFKARFLLTLHIRLHTGERPYKCEICSKGFTQQSVLKDHLFSHTEERPFKCERCKNYFKSERQRKVHSYICKGPTQVAETEGNTMESTEC